MCPPPFKSLDPPLVARRFNIEVRLEFIVYINTQCKEHQQVSSRVANMRDCVLMQGYAITGRGRRSDHPFIKKLNDHVVQEVTVKWKDLGFQLLNNESVQHVLEIIEADHKGEVSILPP